MTKCPISVFQWEAKTFNNHLGLKFLIFLERQFLTNMKRGKELIKWLLENSANKITVGSSIKMKGKGNMRKKYNKSFKMKISLVKKEAV